MGRKESNQTNKNHVIAHFMYLLGQDTTIYISILVLTNFTSLYFSRGGLDLEILEYAEYARTAI